MPLLSQYAKKRKIDYFFGDIDPQAKILEIGCGDGQTGRYFKENGLDYVGMDINPPADVVANIKRWPEAGLQAENFDVIIAFEVVEHVDCFSECYDLLKPGGRLMITTPLPCMDWFLKVLEFFGLNQKRTSRHDHLVYLKNVELFSDKKINIIAGLSQWAIFKK